MGNLQFLNVSILKFTLVMNKCKSCISIRSVEILSKSNSKALTGSVKVSPCSVLSRNFH